MPASATRPIARAASGAAANAHAQLPNLIIIGGLKCGTTSIHHYLGLHPEIQMSKPKELNFFVEELNWDLGLDWYASRFDDRFKVRGESSPHYTNLPRFEGVAERIHEHCPDARLLYMVRDPIKRILSHWVHATGAGYETREHGRDPLRPGHLLHQPLRTGCSCSPTSSASTAPRSRSSPRRSCSSEREGTMRKAFAFAGVDETFTSEQFDREWEKSARQVGRQIPAHGEADQAAGLPLLRPQLRPPAGARCAGCVEKVVHDPEKPPAPKPKLPDDLFELVRGRFAEDVAGLQKFAGREFAGWNDYS